MPGRNRFYATSATTLLEKRDSSSAGPCVFISHQYADLPLATRIGNQLKALEIDVWLDAEDAATQQAVTQNDERKLAEAIERGLSNCTHLLALISAKTRNSWWVPYEIGSVRGRSRDLVFLVHKEVKDLPGYLTFGRKILDQMDFYRWATEVSSNKSLTESRARLQKSQPYGSLEDVLPSIRTQ